MNTTKHEFALHVNNLSQHIATVSKDAEFFFDDETLRHRIATVLRLEVNDKVILFDRHMHAYCQIRSMNGKRRSVFQLLSSKNNTTVEPHITCVLPLLKRDDFEQALYMLAELGVNTIQLMMTDKSLRTWGKEKEIERLGRIVVAAAEQSKCFSMPLIKPPVLLFDVCAEYANVQSPKIYFDAQGEPLLQCMNKASDVHKSLFASQRSFILMVGPEGDLTVHEKIMIQQAGFDFCKLTPTILRAVHAVCVGVGAFRSL